MEEEEVEEVEVVEVEEVAVVEVTGLEGVARLMLVMSCGGGRENSGGQSQRTWLLAVFQ